MIKIERQEEIEGKIYETIGEEFEKYASANGIVCNYQPFAFVAKEGEETLGLITGNTYYKEVHIADLIIYEQHRKKRIGSQLIEAVENYYKGKGFENINLTTYNFQAPEFYKKCGFEVEFIRQCKENPKLNKYYLVKYF